METNLLTRKEAADFLEISISRLNDLCKKGDIVREKIKNKWLIDKQELDKWLEKTEFIGIDNGEIYHLSNLAMKKAQQFADEHRNCFFTVLEKDGSYIVCSERDTITKGKEGWKIIYGCECDFCNGIINTVSPTAFDLIIKEGWYEKSKYKNGFCIFRGYVQGNEWYHPSKPPQEFLDRIQKVLEEELRRIRKENSTR